MAEDVFPMHAAGAHANPGIGPALSSSAGDLSSGAYLVAYAYVNANGKTRISPLAVIALSDDEQIDVASITLPTGITSLDWFVSEEPNSTVLRFIANNGGSSFSINVLPAEDAEMAPSRNTTGGTGVRPNKYIKHPKDLKAITLVSEFEDEGADFNRKADNAPQRWTLVYRDKNEAATKIYRDFWEVHGIDIPFTFVEPRDFPWVSGEPGATVAGVLFEDYDESEPDSVRRHHFTVKLIKRPS